MGILKTIGFRRSMLAPVALLLMGGCQLGRPAPYEGDPLLAQRPVVAQSWDRASSAAPSNFVQVPLQEPLVPSAPALPLATATPPVETQTPTPAPRLPLPGPSPEPAPVPLPLPLSTQVVEASEPTPDRQVSFKATPRQVPGMFGADKNHLWLQGVVDRHYRGYLSLRYRRPSEDDAWGGKVHLLPHPDLEGIEDGTVIQVEGELRPAATPPELEGKSDFPGYSVTAVWVVGDRR